jgi:exopolysaccharide biosynthesis polyprenyl glycosylphosphotransferase
MLPGLTLRDLAGHPGWIAYCSAVGLAWLAGISLLELYDPRHWRVFAYSWARCAFATAVSTVVAFGLLAVVSAPPDEVTLIALLAGQLLGLAAAVSRCGLYLVIPRRLLTRRFLLVGTDPGAAMLAAAIRERREPPTRLVGVVPLDHAPEEVSDLGRLVPPERLADTVAAEAVTDVVQCFRAPVPETLARALSECAVVGARVLSLEDAYASVTEKAAIFNIKDDEWLADVRWVETNLYATQVKRALDILASLLLLPIALPLIGILAALVKCDSEGPAFFRQTRVGLRGRLFTIVKLRTLTTDDSEVVEPGSEAEERRMTAVGRVLRATLLDELPQILQVLKGDMSLVGPRPEQPHLVERYSIEVPLYDERHFVRPGMTGWAQVNQTHAESLRDVVSKVQFDLYYISHLSFRLDALVLMRTLSLTPFGRAKRGSRAEAPEEAADEPAKAS